jgi:hypothetical protein
MSLLPIFSRRKREAEAKADDVYVYDKAPKKLRVQVVKLLSEGLGKQYYEPGGDYSKAAQITTFFARK